MTEETKPEFLCNIVDVYQSAPGRPVEITSDIVLPVEGYQHGDPLQVRHSDGTIIEAKSGIVRYVRDPEFVLSNPDHEFPIVFFLEGITKDSVPIGSELWMIVQHQPLLEEHRKYEKIDGSQG